MTLLLPLNSVMSIAWISPKSFALFSPSSSSSNNYSYYPCKLSKFQFYTSSGVANCKREISAAANEFQFVLHDALDSSGLSTTHARVARDGFFSQIQKFSDIERETSICVTGGVDLGRAALHIAAEDDSLISHSSVPLPVDDFILRLGSLSMGYCSHFSSSFRSSPENFLNCLERYLYVNKGFRRTNAINQVEQRALYLNSVCISTSSITGFPCM
ncbi:hypothetical protein ACJIZ3_018605 [Penstemon smallii]|uniref:Uncharacterized protein n=1 Tax=Penstemon smallii TaxID=265156 RepID=A0ABD3T085_9LAMI